MPKDEFDFDDPMELNGVGFVTEEDTADCMTECFIEEFMRLGYNHDQVLALFRNRHYIGMNMVLQNRGEDFVKNKIAETFAMWGRKVEWRTNVVSSITAELATLNSASEMDTTNSDPMGAAIPNLKL